MSLGNGKSETMAGAGTLGDILHAVHWIKTGLEGNAKDLENRPEWSRIFQGIDKALKKVAKYWNLMEKTPVYWVAATCDPRRNLPWVKYLLREQGRSETATVSLIRQFFESYRDKSRDAIDFEEPKRDMTWESWPKDADKKEGYGFQTNGDKEFFEYTSMGMETFGNTDPVEWWRRNGGRFPTWHRIAMDLLSIPAMSSDVERVFSR